MQPGGGLILCTHLLTLVGVEVTYAIFVPEVESPASALFMLAFQWVCFSWTDKEWLMVGIDASGKNQFGIKNMLLGKVCISKAVDCLTLRRTKKSPPHGPQVLHDHPHFLYSLP